MMQTSLAVFRIISGSISSRKLMVQQASPLLLLLLVALTTQLAHWQGAKAATLSPSIPSDSSVPLSPSATIQVVYNPPGCFGDVVAWNAEAQTAFSQAAALWGSLLTTSQTIVIHACWVDMGGSSTLGSASSAGVFSNFPNAPLANTTYPVALANSLAGSDLNGDSPEIFARFNSAANWYYGNDGNTPKEKDNFIHVVLHELAHGLGFNSALEVEGGLGKWLNAEPSIYERFTEDQAGVSILDPTLYPNNSVALAGALQSNALYFDGPNANAAFGNRRVPLYAPNPYEPSSSHGHLATIFQYTADNLMLPAIDRNGLSPHPGWVPLGILQDLGWAINDDGGPAPFLITFPAQVAVTKTNSSAEPTTIVLEHFVHRPDAEWSLQVASDDGWLATAATMGSGSGPITFTVNSSTLTPGYYTAVVTSTLVDHPAVQKVIPVALVLNEAAITTTNRLQSGDMESLAGWGDSSENVLIAALTISGKNIARSGSNIAVLGAGDNDGNSEEWDLVQTLSIPASERAKLVYYSQVDAVDYCGYDNAQVLINGQVVAVQPMCAATAHDQWRANVIDLSAYLDIHVSQTVTIAFHLENDDSFASRWYLDDVAMLVEEKAVDGVLEITPATIAFSATVGSTAQLTRTLSVQQSEGNPLAWQASEEVDWLSLSAASGTAPTAVTLTVNPNGLAVGSYTGTITFVDSAGSASIHPEATHEVTVQFTIVEQAAAVDAQIFMPFTINQSVP